MEETQTATQSSMLSLVKHVFRYPFYWFVFVNSALALGLLYWWLLSKTTTLITFYSMYWGVPLYFWPYVFLTLASMILFGVTVSVAIYFWQCLRSGFVKEHSGTALGVLFGVFGAGCPVCGAFLLSLLGVIGGIAIFPLKGLELKLLSAGFLATSLIFSIRRLQGIDRCKDCVAEPDNIKPSLYQTQLVILFFILLIAAPLWKQEQIAASADAKNGILLTNKIDNIKSAETNLSLYDEVVSKVLPEEGFQTRIVFGDAVVKLVEHGIIDLEKFKQTYSNREGLSERELAILTQSSSEQIKITANNAGLLVNLLWPIGLANKTVFNEQSPVNGDSLFNFASTGGWTLGKENNGGKYFNKFEIVKLTPEQEKISYEVARNTYRPCCNNSTFFQDCNHGSALLGLIELGASQGLSQDELYKVALRFNSFWFPQNYIETALYHKLAKNIDWENISAQEIMGLNYSSISGWIKNIDQPLKEIVEENPDILQQRQDKAGCGV